MTKLSEVEQEFAEKLSKMLDEVLGIYRNAQHHLSIGDYRSAEKQFDAADRIVDNINTVMSGKNGRNY